MYAFSIENFKRSNTLLTFASTGLSIMRPKHRMKNHEPIKNRPAAEVDCLMSLCQEKFARMLDSSDIIKTHGVKVRVLGDTRLLPKNVQEVRLS